MINGTDRRDDGVRAGTRRAVSKVPQKPPEPPLFHCNVGHKSENAVDEVTELTGLVLVGC
jgi:hypothetical protein